MDASNSSADDASADMSIYQPSCGHNEVSSLLSGEDRLRMLSQRFDKMLSTHCVGADREPKLRAQHVFRPPARSGSEISSPIENKRAPAHLAHASQADEGLGGEGSSEAPIDSDTNQHVPNTVSRTSQTVADPVPCLAAVRPGTDASVVAEPLSAHCGAAVETHVGSPNYYRKEEEFWHERERQLTLLLRVKHGAEKSQRNPEPAPWVAVHNMQTSLKDCENEVKRLQDKINMAVSCKEAADTDQLTSRVVGPGAGSGSTAERDDGLEHYVAADLESSKQAAYIQWFKELMTNAKSSFDKPCIRLSTQAHADDDHFRELHEEIHDAVHIIDSDPPVRLSTDSEVGREIASLEPAFRSFMVCLVSSENRRRNAYKQSIIMTQKAVQAKEQERERQSNERTLLEVRENSSNSNAELLRAKAKMHGIEEETRARIAILADQRTALQLQMQMETAALENQVKHLKEQLAKCHLDREQEIEYALYKQRKEIEEELLCVKESHTKKERKLLEANRKLESMCIKMEEECQQQHLEAKQAHESAIDQIQQQHAQVASEHEKYISALKSKHASDLVASQQRDARASKLACAELEQRLRAAHERDLDQARTAAAAEVKLLESAVLQAQMATHVAGDITSHTAPPCDEKGTLEGIEGDGLNLNTLRAHSPAAPTTTPTPRPRPQPPMPVKSTLAPAPASFSSQLDSYLSR